MVYYTRSVYNLCFTQVCQDICYKKPEFNGKTYQLKLSERRSTVFDYRLEFNNENDLNSFLGHFRRIFEFVSVLKLS